LPVNDTIANHTWSDSYPYAAISAFALHPLYINLEKVAGKIECCKDQSTGRKTTGVEQTAYVDYVEGGKNKIGSIE
jgi:4-alpha-glucanotransferase